MSYLLSVESLFANKYNFQPVVDRNNSIFRAVRNFHGIITYNGGSAFTFMTASYKYEHILCLWTVQDGRDDRWVDEIILDPNEHPDLRVYLDSILEDYLTKIGQGLLRCSKCGKWIPKSETRASGFTGAVCPDCIPEPIDTRGD